MLKNSISIIVPFYNEAECIAERYFQIKNFLEKYFNKYEMIFVDDGSLDESLSILKSAVKNDRLVKLLRYKRNCGRGYAVKQGFKKAKLNLIGYVDSDLEINIKYLLKCYQKIDKGYDGAVASKHHCKSVVKTTFIRKASSLIFSLMIRMILDSQIKDYQTGMKLFKKEVVKQTIPYCAEDGWLFDIEFIYQAQKMGNLLVEVPIKLRYGYRQIKISLIKDFIRSIMFAVRLKRKY